MSEEIKLGSTARDKISGFKGTVIAITDWLNGCRRVTVAPQELKDGKRIESDTFDVQQLELVEATPAPVVPEKRPGGPTMHPTRNADPR
jgi:hypothetical protein